MITIQRGQKKKKRKPPSISELIEDMERRGNYQNRVILSERKHLNGRTTNTQATKRLGIAS
jgi:hypothetical protein